LGEIWCADGPKQAYKPHMKLSWYKNKSFKNLWNYARQLTKNTSQLRTAYTRT